MILLTILLILFLLALPLLIHFYHFGWPIMKAHLYEMFVDLGTGAKTLKDRFKNREKDGTANPEKKKAFLEIIERSKATVQKLEKAHPGLTHLFWAVLFDGIAAFIVWALVRIRQRQERRKQGAVIPASGSTPLTPPPSPGETSVAAGETQLSARERKRWLGERATIHMLWIIVLVGLFFYLDMHPAILERFGKFIIEVVRTANQQRPAKVTTLYSNLGEITVWPKNPYPITFPVCGSNQKLFAKPAKKSGRILFSYDRMPGKPIPLYGSDQHVNVDLTVSEDCKWGQFETFPDESGPVPIILTCVNR